MEKQLCDQCENQCPVDALQCGRGRRHFGLESKWGENEHMRHQQPGGPIGKLRQCGRLLYHNDVSGDDLLSALNPQERTELERLLGTLLEDWKSRVNTDVPASHGGYHHGKRK